MKSGLAVLAIGTLFSLSTPLAYASTSTTPSDAAAMNATTSPSVWTIKSGDTFWTISRATKVSISNIEQSNPNVNPNNLTIGTTLIIPSSATTTKTSNTVTNGKTYTVQPGDTLQKISQQTGVSLQALIQANNLSNPDFLTIGQVLQIPATTGTSTGTASNSGSGTAAGNTAPTGAAATSGTGTAAGSTAPTAGTGSSSGGATSSTTTPPTGTGTAAPTPSTGNATVTYVVQPGDTLKKISQQTGVSLQALIQANNLSNPDSLSIGESLQIPVVSGTDGATGTGGATATNLGTVSNLGTAPRSAPPTAEIPANGTATYLVQAGDTWETIAQTFDVSSQALLDANASVSGDSVSVGTEIDIPTTSTAAQNLYWMERVIHAEADGESLQAQIAVGDVVLNRMQNGAYGGSTVADVVFQVINGKYQFTSVQNGTILNAPHSTNVQAALDVLLNNQNLVPGAYVFYNPTQTPPTSWVWSQTTVTQIDSLVFAV